MKTKSVTTKSTVKFAVSLVCCLILGNAWAGATTVYFSEDFEQGLSRWGVGGDAWRVTDSFYRSAGHCASDSPQGDYALNANSIMAMKVQYRVNLASSVFPILSFWHRIGVGKGDYGYVEISRDNGFTWTAVAFFTDTHRSTWSRERVDLSAYKASPILIRFRLRDDGGRDTGVVGRPPTVSAGWDIDDVEIREVDAEALAFPLFDDFESGMGNWISGDWQLTASYARSQTHSLTDSNNANYPQHACSDLILAHPIDLSSSVYPVLSFWHRISVGQGDFGYVEVSEDGGLSWRAADPTHPGQSAFTDLVSANWAPELIDLSAYKSSPILIRFRLRDDGGRNIGVVGSPPTVSAGWDIDDVEVREIVYPPLEHSLIVQIVGVDTSDCPTVRSTVLVTDASGEAAGGLNATHFSVYENGSKQTPIAVELSRSRVCVSLALDYSGSMSPAAIQALETAAKGFVEVLRPGDCGEIIKFAKGVEVMQEYTDDRPALLGAVQRATTLERSATALYDAIDRALSDTAERPSGKAVIVLSDGRDNHSQQSATAVIAHARAEGIPIFTIGLGDEIDQDVLIAIASQTGGIYYSAPTAHDLVAVYEKIAGTLKTQYLVTYETTICGADSSATAEHELRIEVSRGAAYGQDTRKFHGPVTNTPMVDVVGDKDGFGLGLWTGDEYTGFFDKRQSADPVFTDVHPVAQSFSYSHTVAIPVDVLVSAATLRWLTLGIQDGDSQVKGSDTDMRLFVDGREVPGAFDTVDQFHHNGTAWVSFVGLVEIPLTGDALHAVQDGQVEIRIEIHQLGTISSTDAVAFDYSELEVKFSSR
ncbi:MAG: VWA domain-containing protein [Planctomycetes bacterium]|nr:VWA domain-containing protein [Planctomycetota bacterium]